MVASALEPLRKQHGWTAEKFRTHWNWVQGSGFLNNSELSPTWQLARNAFPLLGLNFRAGLADMPYCARCGSGLKETAEHAFNYCQRVSPFWDHIGEWKDPIEPKQLVLLDVCYVVDNVLPPFQGEKRVVFLAILAVARWGFGRHERRNCMTMQTLLIVIWYYSLVISLGSRSDAIENAWTA